MLATEATRPAGILRYWFSEPKAGAAGPGILLDRDGVINQQVTGTYVTRLSEFHFVPGIVDALTELSRLPVPIIVVSNQAGIGKGMFTPGDLEEITHGFVARLNSAGARIDAAYYCPHAPGDGCECRKPRHGLLMAAARDWKLDLSRSVFVGDSPSDADAGKAAGCRTVLVTGPDVANLTSLAGTTLVSGLKEMTGCIIRVLEGVKPL